MPRMRRLNGSRIVFVLLILGVLAWIGIAGLIVLESRPRPSAPTEIAPRTAQPTRVAELPAQASATPTPAPSEMLPPTSAPTIAPTDTAAPATQTPPPTRLPTLLPTLLPTVIPLVAAPSLLAETPAATVTAVAASLAASPAAGNCPPPSGWVAYTVQPGDTLFGFQLGSDNAVDVATIMQANCLQSKLLSIGQVLFLPAGVAEKSPKIDDDAGPSGPRPANCPCQLVIRPGWRIGQIAAAIDKLPAPFAGRDLVRVTAAGVSTPDHWFLRDRPAGATLEGFLFPGTYTIENGMSAEAFRDMVLANFAANVGADLAGQAAAHGLTFWQVVNMASILQRESYAPSEQVMIASVMFNRIAAGKGLGMSVTQQYAEGVPGNWWPPIGTVNIHADTPYNTNRRRGLPPTPISNPGLDAMRAVLYPAQTDYQYYSAKCGGGGNFYARTFEEFKQGLECK